MDRLLGLTLSSLFLWFFLFAPAYAVTKANFDKVTASFQWETVSTPVPGLNCDDCSSQINIGFDFPFAGERFNKIYVSSNGFLSLLAGVRDYSNKDLPTSDLTKTASALIMPYWDDLKPAAGGSVTYGTFGSAPQRRLVVSWNAVPHYPNTGQYNVQVILYETGEIKFQYGAGNSNGVSATIGIEVTNDDFIKHSYNQYAVTPNSALLFRPQPYVQGVLQPCGSSNQLTVQYSYPVASGSADRKQNYSFSSSSTPGLKVTSATLSADGYSVTLALNKNLQAGGTYQLQIKDVQTASGRTINPNPTTRPISGGAGLVGTYYSQYAIQRNYHQGPWVKRNDATVDFSWGTSTPDVLPRGDDFSVRWEGYLIPSRTGSHVFQTYSDDGIRLWVNGSKVLDAWNDHAPRYDTSSPVTLIAGNAVPIVLEHYERGGQAYARLFWDEPDGTSGNFSLIPSSALSPCPLTTAGPDHIRIEHDGEGLTCQPESLTIKACADAACSTLFTGDVTVDLTSPSSGWSADPITISGGSATLNLSVSSASTITLGASATSPTATNPTRCFRGSTESCQMVFSACAESFTCLEAREPSSGNDLRTGRLYTKLAGTAFSVDVAALRADGTRETNYVTSGGSPRSVWVELVDASGGGACSSLPALNPAISQTVTFTSSDQGRKSLASMTVNQAWRHVKCRVTDTTVSPSKVACSTDGFAIRPTAFSSVTTTVATADTSHGADPNGAPRLKAGSDPFDLRALAITGYDGTPKTDASKLEAHDGAQALGALLGGFDPAPRNTGEAVGHAFTYSEVGYFRLGAEGVYDDDFTQVDSAGGDCTNDFSNTQDGNTKYGCKFRNTNPSDWFGRFIPHHFDTEVSDACTGFSYSGQPFGLKVTAKNSASGTVQNYQGSFAKPVGLSNVTGTSGQFTRDFLACTQCVESSDFNAGEADLMANKKIKIAFEFSSKTTAPATLQVRANDADTGAASGSNEGQTLLRAGRMKLGQAHQFLETQSLTLPVLAEYYDGSTFIQNQLDSCTKLDSPSLVRLDNNQQQNQTTGSISVGGGSTTLSGWGTFSSGALNLDFSAPGAGHAGFVDITPMLGVNEAGKQPWLRYDWDGDGAHDDNPVGRASWGMYRGNKSVIYLRERWN
jgi:hypothetical protein